MSLPRVVLKPRRARPFFARHPWVFANSIARLDGDAAPGDEVAVVSHEGVFIAQGLYNPHSAIRVRLYRWDKAEPPALDEAFWRHKIDSALRLRNALGLGPDVPLGASRLVFSEADGLSGLTVDRYDRYLVAQFTSLALFERRDLIVRLLAEAARPEGIWLRTESGVAGLEGLDSISEPAYGTLPNEPVEVEEHGLRFAVDLKAGQKTGFYIDQRDNRLAAARYAARRTVLDLFCHAGGFGLVALKHGSASRVFGIDSSAPAVAAARQHAERNGLAESARFEAGDAFDHLERLAGEGERFGMVVLDPPKYARRADGVEEALKRYLRLNRAAVQVLEPRGILVTCSCSGHVDRQIFAQMLGQVAEHSGRPIQILEQRGQAPDHPVSASCLETDYLKCFVCRVD